MMASVLLWQFKEEQCRIVLRPFSRAPENWIWSYKQNGEDGHLLRRAMWNATSTSEGMGPWTASWVFAFCSHKGPRAPSAEAFKHSVMFSLFLSFWQVESGYSLKSDRPGFEVLLSHKLVVGLPASDLTLLESWFTHQLKESRPSFPPKVWE